MSSILDALEKADKERAAKGGAAPAGTIGQESATERRLREEASRHRRQMRLMAGAAAVLLLLVVAGGAAWVLSGRAGSGPASGGGGPDGPQAASLPAGAPIAEAAPPPSPTPAAASTPSPSPKATPTAMPSPTPTPAPSPTPPPSPTSWPSPTPWPSPVPPSPTASAPARAPQGYEGIYRDGDVIRAEEIGLNVTGLMEFGGTMIAIINGKEVRPGQKVGMVHIIEIQRAVLTVDVGDAVVKARF